MDEVKEALEKEHPQLAMRFGEIVRKAYDEVIDPESTGRVEVSQLEKTEKTYIGTRVEIITKRDLELERGKKLDTKIAGHEVDIKFSISRDWYIPRECVGELCLVIAGDDKANTFDAGIVRATAERLGAPNQDKKRPLTAKGKKAIIWFAKDAPLPKSRAAFMRSLPSSTMRAIEAKTSGQARVEELLRNVQKQPIPRSAIVMAAQQKDPMKRVRDAKKRLANEGITVLVGRSSADHKAAEEEGIKLHVDEVLSIPTRKR